MSRIKPGDRVLVKGWPPVSMEVIDASDRSILVLRSAYGTSLKVGRLAVIPATENDVSTTVAPPLTATEN
jgi:hypothetical protein